MKEIKIEPNLSGEGFLNRLSQVLANIQTLHSNTSSLKPSIQGLMWLDGQSIKIAIDNEFVEICDLSQGGFELDESKLEPYANKSLLNAPSGIAKLDENAKIPAHYLPKPEIGLRVYESKDEILATPVQGLMYDKTGKELYYQDKGELLKVNLGVSTLNEKYSGDASLANEKLGYWGSERDLVSDEDRQIHPLTTSGLRSKAKAEKFNELLDDFKKASELYVSKAQYADLLDRAKQLRKEINYDLRIQTAYVEISADGVLLTSVDVANEG